MTFDRNETENLINIDGSLDTKDGYTLSSCEVEDNDFVIKGFLPDGKKARYNSVSGKTFYGKSIAQANIITMNYRPTEDAVQFQLKAMETKKANNEKKRNFNELARAMLEQTVPEKKIQAILGDDTTMLLDNTVAGVMLGRMIQEACNGSYRCAEFVRDTAGYKPKQEVDIQADVITEADRSLLSRIESRTG